MSTITGTTVIEGIPGENGKTPVEDRIREPPFPNSAGLYRLIRGRRLEPGNPPAFERPRDSVDTSRHCGPPFVAMCPMCQATSCHTRGLTG